MRRSQIHFFIHAVPLHSESALAGEAPGVSAGQLDQPFNTTFETLCQRIDEMPGAYTEPDGAIGWNPTADHSLGGTIHCIDDRVMCVEFFSTLDRNNLESIIDVCCPARSEYVVQLAEQGSFVTIDELLSMAE